MPGQFADVRDLPQPATDYAWSISLPSGLPSPANDVLANTVSGLVDNHGPEAISILAKSVGFSPMSLTSEEDTASKASYATGREFPEFTVTFYENRDWGVHKVFQAWSEAMFSTDRYQARGRGVVKPPSTYTRPMKVDLVDMRTLEGEVSTVAEYKARHAWPSALEEIDLDYENDGIETFQVTFQSHAFQLTGRTNID